MSDYPTTPHITLRRIDSTECFRSKVHKRPNFLPILEVFFSKRCRQTEVDNLDADIAWFRMRVNRVQEKYIFWFDIPMNDAHLMNVIHTSQ